MFSKFTKVILVILCVTILSTGVAFAQAEVTTQAVESVSEESLLQKQSEIDTYLFVDHVDEIEQWGFSVTHTAPIGGSIEIGITPYNEANANALYEIFGTEMVNVVEGIQAVTLDESIVTVAQTSDNTPDFLLPISIAFVIISAGGVYIFNAKQKASEK